MADLREISEDDFVTRVPARPEHKAVVSIDLGQANDYTAIAVIEKEVVPLDDWRWHDTRRNVQVQQADTNHRLRALRRLPLGVGYDVQAEQIGAALDRVPMPRKDIDLVIDYGGVGRACFDIFKRAGLDPLGIQLTGGGQSRRDGRIHYVPKREVISSLEAALHMQTLKFPHDLAAADELHDELRDFQRHVTAAGNAKFEGRIGTHDDIVLAVACGMWLITRPKQTAGMIRLTGHAYSH